MRDTRLDLFTTIK